MVLDGLSHNLIVHLVLWKALLPTKLTPIQLCEPLKLIICEKPIPPWVVFIEHLGRLILGWENALQYAHFLLCMGVIGVRRLHSLFAPGWGSDTARLPPSTRCTGKGQGCILDGLFISSYGGRPDHIVVSWYLPPCYGRLC